MNKPRRGTISNFPPFPEPPSTLALFSILKIVKFSAFFYFAFLGEELWNFTLQYLNMGGGQTPTIFFFFLFPMIFLELLSSFIFLHQILNRFSFFPFPMEKSTLKQCLVQQSLIALGIAKMNLVGKFIMMTMMIYI